MNAPQVISAEVKEQIQKAELEANQFAGLQISTQEQYSEGGEVMVQIAKKEKDIIAKRKKITNPLDESKKEVMDLFRKPLELLAQAKATIGNRMLTFKQEQDRKAREEQRKRDEEARKKEEAEKKKIDKKIEDAKNRGDKDAVKDLKGQKENVHVQAGPVAPAVPKAKGVATRKIWKYKVLDPKKVPQQYWVLNEKLLNSIAKSSGKTMQIPGIKFYQDEVMQTRT